MQILSASQPDKMERGSCITGNQGKTLMVDTLQKVAKTSPQHTLEEWLADTEEELSLAEERLYPLPNDDYALTPLLFDCRKDANRVTLVAP